MIAGGDGEGRDLFRWQMGGLAAARGTYARSASGAAPSLRSLRAACSAGRFFSTVKKRSRTPQMAKATVSTQM